MAKRHVSADPTAKAAIARADQARPMPADRALRLAAEAKARGDMAGYEHFMAVVWRAVGAR